MATFRAQIPAAGRLLSSTNAEVRGIDLEAQSLFDIYELVGSEPTGRTEKRVISYRTDGTAIVEIETEDIAWANAALAALGPVSIEDMRRTGEMARKQFIHAPDGAEGAA